MHTRWSLIGWCGLLLLAIGVAAGCRDRTPADRYPTNLGTDAQPLLPTPVGAYKPRVPDGKAQIVAYQPGAPGEATEDETTLEAPSDQPFSAEDVVADHTEPQAPDTAGGPPSPEDEAAIRELCQAVKEGGVGQLQRFVVPDQAARVGAIIGPVQDLFDVLGEISEESADTAPQAAAIARQTREQILGNLAGAMGEVSDLRMLGADQATGKSGGTDVFFERVQERWLVRISDLPDEGKATAFANAMRDLIDAFQDVADGLRSGDLTDAAAVARMTTAAQQFASQTVGLNP